jgi:hypothetical protein
MVIPLLLLPKLIIFNYNVLVLTGTGSVEKVLFNHKEHKEFSKGTKLKHYMSGLCVLCVCLCDLCGLWISTFSISLLGANLKHFEEFNLRNISKKKCRFVNKNFLC